MKGEDVCVIYSKSKRLQINLDFLSLPWRAMNGPMTNMDTEHFHSSRTLDAIQHTYSIFSTLLNRRILSNGSHPRLPC